MKLMPKNYYFDELFDNFFVEETSKMKCDIYEKNNKYYIEVDIPGFKKEDIKIEIHKGNLTITASNSVETEEKDEKKYIRHERVYGKFQRSFYLGEIEEESVEAAYENGTITISVSKKDEKDTKKYIEIK